MNIYVYSFFPLKDKDLQNIWVVICESLFCGLILRKCLFTYLFFVPIPFLKWLIYRFSPIIKVIIFIVISKLPLAINDMKDKHFNPTKFKFKT